MASGRLVSKNIVKDTGVNSLKSDLSRLGFTWTIPFLDRDGRIEGDATLLRNTVFPRRRDVTYAQMEDMILDWAARGLVILYEVCGERFLEFPGFRKNQPNLRYDREFPSDIPPKENGKILKGPDPCRSDAGVMPDPCRSDAGVMPAEGKGREGKLIQGKGREGEPPDPAALFAKHLFGKFLETVRFYKSDYCEADLETKLLGLLGLDCYDFDKISSAINHLRVEEYWQKRVTSFSDFLNKLGDGKTKGLLKQALDDHVPPDPRPELPKAVWRCPKCNKRLEEAELTLFKCHECKITWKLVAGGFERAPPEEDFFTMVKVNQNNWTVEEKI